MIKPKVRRIKPYTRKWEELANELARARVTIHPCADCGHPVIHGYCCEFCGSVDPYRKRKEEGK